jgi:hypothetical protein
MSIGYRHLWRKALADEKCGFHRMEHFSEAPNYRFWGNWDIFNKTNTIE